MGARSSGAPTPVASRHRIDAVDAARGVAVAMMIAYHFCFDLTYYRWADWRMLDDTPWIAWRSAIVTSFLLLVGISLALRDRGERDDASGSGPSDWFDRRFVRRWLQIAGAAALVSGGSALLFPQTFIYFGVLHFVAVALWLCRRAPRLRDGAIHLGGAAIAVGLAFAHPAFDPRIVDWIGFATEKPLTEDYVPLFPWIGVVLIGCGAGARWTAAGPTSPSFGAAWNALPDWLHRSLATMGRRSLTIYLLHQPLLLGAMGLIKQAGG